MRKKQAASIIAALSLIAVVEPFGNSVSAQTPYFTNTNDIFNWLNRRYGGGDSTWQIYNQNRTRRPQTYTPNTEQRPQVNTPNAPSANSEEQQVNEQVNQYRASRGLPPLQMNEELNRIAQQHSEYQASISDINHNGFDSRSRQIASFIPNYGGAAENVAYNAGFGDPASRAVQGWINSSGHRRNMEGNYNQTGIGVAERNGRTYFTQLFARGGDSGSQGSDRNSPAQLTQPQVVPEMNNNSDSSNGWNWSQPTRVQRGNSTNRPNIYWYYR